jgi:hypothetical protein
MRQAAANIYYYSGSTGLHQIPGTPGWVTGPPRRRPVLQGVMLVGVYMTMASAKPAVVFVYFFLVKADHRKELSDQLNWAGKQNKLSRHNSNVNRTNK